MKGYYGIIYDRVDGAVILEWLMKYDNERDVEVEEIRVKENKQLKKELGTPLVLDVNNPVYEDNYIFKSNMIKLRDQLAKNKKERDDVKQNKAENPKDPVWEMSQIWMTNFNKFHALRPHKIGINGPRFIKRYGRILDVNAYLEHKHWQWFTFNNQVIRGNYRKEYLNKAP
jgi:hypothetical protein